MKNHTDLNLVEVVYMTIIIISQILELIYCMFTIFIFDGVILQWEVAMDFNF